MDLHIAYSVSAAFALFVGAGMSALFLPKQNTLAQALLIAGGVCGLGAAAAFAFLNPQGGSLALFGGHFALSLPASFFFGLVSLGTLLSSLFAIGYLPRYALSLSFREVNLAFAFFVIGMCAVVLADSPAAFLFFWEVMSVAAYFLVIADKSEDSLKAGFIYFVMTQMGFFCLLAGFLLLSQGELFVPWEVLRGTAPLLGAKTLMCAFFLLFAGFGSKAGLVPLHQWLPYAHPQAPSHASALLSGSMLVVALYGFLNASLLFPSIPLSWALVVILVGLLSALFGALHAAVESDAKRLLAYSSIEHMGLLFAATGVLFGLMNSGGHVIIEVLKAGLFVFIIFHTANHFFFKTGLFLSIGAIMSETHTRDLDEMGGLARAWPIFSGVVLVLSLSAAALPPFGTFFSEWLLVQSLAHAAAVFSPLFAIIGAVMLAVVGLVAGLALFASVKMFATLFLGRPRTAHAEKVKPLPLTLTIAPALCAVCSAVSGFAVMPFIAPRLGAAMSSPLTDTSFLNATINVWYVLCFFMFAGGAAYLIQLFTVKKVRTTGTWDCGAPLTPRMQYSATGFAAPIRFFFRMLLVTKKDLVSVPASASNPWITAKRLDWSVNSIWERWFYARIGAGVLAAAHFIRRLQSGVVQAYLLLVLVTLVVTLILAL